MEHDPTLMRQAERLAADTRRLRRRARLDLVLGAAMTISAALLGRTAHEALLAGSAALSLAILLYVIRRDRDLRRLAQQGLWRERALEGRGVPLEAWHAGARLSPWPDRRPPDRA